MVYRDTDQTPTGEQYSQTFLLTYTDRRHFTTVLLSHSAVPEAVGWTSERDGSLSRTVDPRLGTVSRSTDVDEGVVPDYWLRPSARPWLATRPGAVTVQAGQGLERSSVSWTLEDGRRHTEALTFRIEDGIPTLYTESIDGKEIRRIEVLEFSLR